MVRKKAASKAQALRSSFYEATILEAAEEMFARHGFANARMSQVAERAALSVGTVYNAFASKEALHAAVLKQRRTELMKRMTATLGDQDASFERIAEAVRVHTAFCVEYPNFVRLQQGRVNAWSLYTGALSPGERKDFERGLAAAAAVCERAIAKGELISEDPQRMVLTMVAMYQVHIQSWLHEGMTEAAADVAARVIALFRRAFLRGG